MNQRNRQIQILLYKPNLQSVQRALLLSIHSLSHFTLNSRFNLILLEEMSGHQRHWDLSSGVQEHFHKSID